MLSKYSIKTAYALFLIVCFASYSISRLLDLNFESCGNIICAVTIASYFFTCSSSLKSINDKYSIMIDSINDGIKGYIKLRDDAEHHPENDDKVVTVEDLNQCIFEDSAIADELKKYTCKYNKWIFVLDVMGFLLFLCIITFKSCYTFFAKSLDLYTLLAFFLFILVDIIEELWQDRVNIKIASKQCIKSIANSKRDD